MISQDKLDFLNWDRVISIIWRCFLKRIKEEKKSNIIETFLFGVNVNLVDSWCGF